MSQALYQGLELPRQQGRVSALKVCALWEEEQRTKQVKYKLQNVMADVNSAHNSSPYPVAQGSGKNSSQQSSKSES